MKKILDQIMILCCMAASLFCFGSCSDDLDIQQEYPFTVEAMPVADKIVSGQTVEIRLEITEEGNFSGTLYTLRYFQPDGNGLLKLEDGTVLKPNDRYLLSEKKFRLYYTSRSTGMTGRRKRKEEPVPSKLSRMFLNCSDEKYTPGYGVAPIIKYLPEGKIIWCPFDTCHSEFVLHLQEAGFQVKYSHINTGQDFFCLRAGLLGYYCI